MQIKDILLKDMDTKEVLRNAVEGAFLVLVLVSFFFGVLFGSLM